MQRNILLNPGPVTTSDKVKNALCVPDICHRENEFTELLKSIRLDLPKIVHAKDDYTSVLFTASGTGAVEAAVTSVVPKGKKLVVINNGSYGQRILKIAERYGIATIAVTSNYDEPLDFAKIAAALQQDDVAYLAMIHHETSSGILNPLTQVGALCQQHNVGFIVDAMSSFAGTDIDVYRDYIDFIAASSNKCLHGMPGLSFVVCSKNRLLETEGNARSHYLDLHQQYRALEKDGQMPFTPAVQVAYALRAAMDEFFSETLTGRIARYQRNYACLAAGLTALGYKIVTPAAGASKMLMTVQFPDDGQSYDFDQLHDYCYKKGYTIYPRKLAIDDTFRLACIGQLTEADIQQFLQVLKVWHDNKQPHYTG